MRQLKDLMACGEGLAFLAERDMFVRQADFAARLQAPVNGALTAYFSAPPGKPVYALQQIYTDCTPSMLDRMALLRELEQHPACMPFFLWIDTDLAGSDPLMLRMLWTVFGKQASLRLCPAANDVRELRFIPVDPAAVRDGLAKLEVYVSQSVTGRKKVARARIRERLETLRAVLSAGAARCAQRPESPLEPFPAGQPGRVEAALRAGIRASRPDHGAGQRLHQPPRRRHPRLQRRRRSPARPRHRATRQAAGARFPAAARVVLRLPPPLAAAPRNAGRRSIRRRPLPVRRGVSLSSGQRAPVHRHHC